MTSRSSRLDYKEPTRVFIVGFPRSGTTLLQSFLAAHPEVFSLPETHFFEFLSSKQRIFRWLGVPAEGAVAALNRLLGEAGEEPSQISLRARYQKNHLAREFIRLLDRKAVSSGKPVWVEKTPRHLHFIPYISTVCNTAQFVHISRDPFEAISSLHAATNQYPDWWGGARTLDQCIDRWIGDYMITKDYGHHPAHHLLEYEKLVETPREVLSGLCDFIGIPFVETMIENRSQAASAIVPAGALWLDRVHDGDVRLLQRTIDDCVRERVKDRLKAIGVTWSEQR